MLLFKSIKNVNFQALGHRWNSKIFLVFFVDSLQRIEL